MIPEDDPNDSGSEYSPPTDETDDSSESEEIELDTKKNIIAKVETKNKVFAKVDTKKKKFAKVDTKTKIFTEVDSSQSKSKPSIKQSLLKMFLNPNPESIHVNKKINTEMTIPEENKENSCKDNELLTTNVLKTKITNSDKLKKKSLLEKMSTDQMPKDKASTNVNDDMDNGEKEHEQNKIIESCEVSVSTSEFCASTFVEEATNILLPKKNAKRKRNEIQDFGFPNQIIPYSDAGGQYYYKVNCCCFCYSLELRVDRHYITNHPEEKEVQLLILSKSRTERKQIFKVLRLRGNDFFNTNKTLNPNGIILSSRRVSRKQEAKKQQSSTGEHNSNEKDSVPAEAVSAEKGSKTDIAASGVFKLKCAICNMYVAASNLRNHVRLAHPDSENQNSKQIINEAKRCMLEMHEKTTPKVRDFIFSKIRDPIISALVRHDILMVLFANKLSDRFTEIKQLDMVRGYVRLLAKFLLEMKNLNPQIKEFKSIFNHEHFHNVITAIRRVSDYDERTQRFGITYNAETLPLLLRKCFKILQHHLILINDSNSIENLNKFIGFFEDDIQNAISVKACLSRKELNRHTNDKPLPSSKDIAIFREFLNFLRNDILEKISITKTMTYQQYSAMMACVALLIETFNRRRNGEVGRVLLDDFNSIKKANKDCEFFQQLTEEEKSQRLQFYRMDILGKRFDGKGSLYMDSLDYKCLKMLVKFRKTFNIPETNVYLFAATSGRDNVDKHIDMYEAMCRYSKQCNYEYKRIDYKLMRSTGLRKHAATVNGTIDNGKNTTMCAELLGHSERIQKTKYKRTVDKQDVDNVNFLKQINSPRREAQLKAQRTPSRPALPILESSNDEESPSPDGKIKSSIRWIFLLYILFIFLIWKDVHVKLRLCPRQLVITRNLCTS